jgi:hypothetical protein
MAQINITLRSILHCSLTARMNDAWMLLHRKGVAVAGTGNLNPLGNAVRRSILCGLAHVVYVPTGTATYRPIVVSGGALLALLISLVFHSLCQTLRFHLHFHFSLLVSRTVALLHAACCMLSCDWLAESLTLSCDCLLTPPAPSSRSARHMGRLPFFLLVCIGNDERASYLAVHTTCQGRARAVMQVCNGLMSDDWWGEDHTSPELVATSSCVQTIISTLTNDRRSVTDWWLNERIIK